MEYKVSKKVLGFYISAVACKIGPELLVMVYGGEKSHIGSVSIASPDNVAESITLSTHRDNIISEIYSKKLADEFSCNVSATCGIHYENPTKEDLNRIVFETEILLQELVDAINSRQSLG